MQWWVSNIFSQYRVIRHETPNITIETDASLSGWGAILGKKTTGGRWAIHEQNNHINALELMAIFLALKAFIAEIKGKHILIMCDNTTAVSYISNMGGIKSTECNKISRDIWLFCIQNSIWVSVSHISGKNNVRADLKSRKFNDQLEWKLNTKVFNKLCAIWQKPDIDLFASRLNYQIDKFCSWEPDPQATFINAFTIDWSCFEYIYVFPPFSVLNRCIRKIKTDKASGLIIAPYWPTQIWFPSLMEILTDNPILIPRKTNLLMLPHLDKLHPLGKKLILIACQVSGKISEVEDFLKHQQEFSWHHGSIRQRNSITRTSKNGLSTVVKGKLINFRQLWRM